jgi:hypothetical protein
MLILAVAALLALGILGGGIVRVATWCDEAPVGDSGRDVPVCR